MYKCVECGRVFEEGEEAVWYEDRGEFWGVPCSERETGCPRCHEPYEEASRCKGCGEWHLSDELDGGLCDDCREETEDENDG